jgi:hypothetical protein
MKQGVFIISGTPVDILLNAVAKISGRQAAKLQHYNMPKRLSTII